MRTRIIVTTTLFEDESCRLPYVAIRKECSLKMIKAARDAGCIVIVADGGSSIDFIANISCLGAVVICSPTGMEVSRNTAFRSALEIAKSGDVILWTEPEKYPLIPHLPNAWKKIDSEKLDMLMLNRVNLSSYSLEQACSYFKTVD